MSSRNSGLKPIGAVIGDSGGLLERLENIRKRNSDRTPAAERGRPSNVSTVHEQMERAKERDKALSLVRNPPQGDAQPDFLRPAFMTWAAVTIAASWMWPCSVYPRRTSEPEN